MAPGTCVMESLPDQSYRTTGTLLKCKGRIKGLPTGTGTLAWSSHGQFSSTFRAPVLTEQNVKIEFLNLFFKQDNSILNMRDPFHKRIGKKRFNPRNRGLVLLHSIEYISQDI